MKKMEWISQNIGGPEVIVLIGAIIAAIGAFWFQLEQRRHASELAEKNAEIAELNRYIAQSITGGDSFGYLELLRIADSPNLRFLAAGHNGKFPVYDVSFEVLNASQLENLRAGKPDTEYVSADMLQDRSKVASNYEVGNLAPNSTKPLGDTLNLDTIDKLHLKVTISARNGFVYQDIWLELVDGKWMQATSIVGHPDWFEDEGPNRILFEEIDDGFPHDLDSLRN